MASSKSVSAPIVLLFSLNLLLFFTLISSQPTPPPPPPTCGVTVGICLRNLVNLARFNARSHYWGRVDSFGFLDQNASIDGARTSFVNANMLGQNMVEKNVFVEVSSPCLEFGPKFRHKSFVQDLLNNNNLSNPKNHDLNFILGKDAPRVIEDQLNRKCCIAEVNFESLHRLEKCYDGIVDGCYEADFLLDKFKRKGIVNVAIKKIASNHSLLEFKGKATRQMVF
ncbi:hypothetical protein REPUB_Repub08aG0203400 [Reevesia pubescens]